MSDTTTKTGLREGDVVRYTPMRTHCREGMAIAERDRGGALRLWDTYWHSDRPEVTTLDFEVLFNVADYELVNEWMWNTHKAADRQRVTHQHGHQVDYYVRVGSTEDRATMIENARQELTDAEEELRRAEGRVKDRARMLDLLLADA